MSSTASPTTGPELARGDRWLYRVWVLSWLSLFGMGCTFVLYAFEIQYRSPLIRAPHVTLGSMAYVLDHIVRMTAWGVVLVGFLHGILPVREAAAHERHRALGRALRVHSPRAALFILALALLGAVRDLGELDLFDERFGEGLYRGGMGLRDWLSGTTLGLAAVAGYLVLEPGPPASRSGSEVGDGCDASVAGAPPPTALAKLASGLLLLTVIYRIFTWPPSYFAQDRHFEHIAVCSLTWELALIAALVAGDDPLRHLRALGSWFTRNQPVLQLLLMLEVLRVVSHQDWYYELAWLPTLLEHSPTNLVFFRGQLHDVTRLVVLAPPLALVLGLWVLRTHRRLDACGTAGPAAGASGE